MAKVVTERPRRGSSAPSAKTHRKIDPREVDAEFDGYDCYGYDSGPLRAPVSRHRQYGLGAKEFSDLLGPLRRYLRKQVGRPWDKVYSELSAYLDRRSIAGQHIWDHVKREVEQHCILGDDWKIYRIGRYTTGWFEVDGLYVHPKTRLLCYKPEHGWRRGWPKKPDQNKIVIDDLHFLERRDNGAWFLFTYERLDPNEIMRYDYPLYAKRYVHGQGLVPAPSAPLVPIRRKDIRGEETTRLVSKRQIGRKDKELWALVKGL